MCDNRISIIDLSEPLCDVVFCVPIGRSGTSCGPTSASSRRPPRADCSSVSSTNWRTHDSTTIQICPATTPPNDGPFFRQFSSPAPCSRPSVGIRLAGCAFIRSHSARITKTDVRIFSRLQKNCPRIVITAIRLDRKKEPIPFVLFFIYVSLQPRTLFGWKVK